MENKTIVKADENKQDILITRVFDLPVELLYKAHTEAEFLEQWMGTKVLKLENKKHGSFQFETSYNGQVMFKANGTIHDLILNQSIVRTFEIENSEIGVQLEFLEFEKIADNTSKLSIHIIYKSVAHRDEQLKLPFEYGINMAHNQLQEIANKLKR